MALARANDAVKLAYCQEPTEDEIRRLDLGAVAEFRRSNLGSVEIRFIDRVKALQALAGMLEGEGCEAEEFFRANGAGGGGSVKEMIPLSLRQRKAFIWWARREYEDYAAIICDGCHPLGQDVGDGNGLFLLGDGVLFPTGSLRCAGGAWARCGATCWKRCCRSCEGWALPARRSGAKSC